VRIEKGKMGGKLTIDYFSSEDLQALLEKLHGMSENKSAGNSGVQTSTTGDTNESGTGAGVDVSPVDDRTKQEIDKDNNEELYSLKNFSV
jgi:GH24 family phage-related lysozyme (muramidase)